MKPLQLPVISPFVSLETPLGRKRETKGNKEGNEKVSIPALIGEIR
jgi:hypothetical protein